MSVTVKIFEFSGPPQRIMSFSMVRMPIKLSATGLCSAVTTQEMGWHSGNAVYQGWANSISEEPD
jgi:hypothetical protein